MTDLTQASREEQLSLDGPHGDLAVRVYRSALEPIGGLVWVHGGAFVGGDLDMAESHWVAQQVAAAGYVVVTVDYRLAPTPEAWASFTASNPEGVRFPVASEEVGFTFIWASQQSGLAPDGTWSLGGASAGANLAAGAALRMRDGGDRLPHSLVLAYPLLHKELPPLCAELQVKYDSLPAQGRFSPETVMTINTNYVGHPDLLDHPYAFPGGHDVGGLPPTLIINSDIDSLRSSGEAFGTELATAGVDVSVVREPLTLHGHLNEPETVGAQRSIRRIHTWLLDGLHQSHSEGTPA
jgi:acetyl esterase